MTCTPECLKATAESKAAITAYIAAWPNYCTSCGGVGYHADHGSFWEPPAADPCGACSEKGLCPRCMKPTIDAETGEGPCTACGWVDGAPSLPDGYDGCECWIPTGATNENL